MTTIKDLTAELEKVTAFEFPVDKIHASPYNPRLVFDKDKLQSLAANIKAVGVQQAILLRPHPTRTGEAELVFGERRWRASKLAELETIPARVRELSTLEVLELQAYENGQRDDVHPLEEADHFMRMHKPPKDADYPPQSIEEIMAKSGKSRAAVYQALKLTELGEVSRKLFLEGKLMKTTADLVARIQPQKLQDEAAKELARGDGMSFRDAFDYVKQNYTLTLEGCGFDTSDPKLVEKAGPCSTCPKRSGNQLELIGDVKKPDVCMDRVCFKSKQDAAWALRARAEQEKGRQVLAEKDAKNLFSKFNRDEPVGNAGYVGLGEVCYEDPQRRTYKQLFGKDAPVVVARNPHTGKAVELIPTAGLKKALVEEGHKWAKPKKSTPATSTKTKAPSGPSDWEIHAEARRRVAAALVAKMEKAGQPSAEILRFALASYAGGYHDGMPAIERRLGIDGDEMVDVERERVEELTAKMTIAELLAFAVEVLLDDVFSRGMYSNNKDADKAAKLAGVEYANVKKQAAADLKARFKKACKGCGCTEAKPCKGGCSWALDLAGEQSDLCSACVATGKWTITEDGWFKLADLESAA